MADRRTEILDAALRVLAEQGMRGLTHRAVDAAAGIAAGSTSYYFRSRSALVAGCVARLVELDQAVEVPEMAAAAPGGLVDALVAVTVAMATTGRHRTLARYELSLAGVREPGLRAALVEGGDVIRRAGRPHAGRRGRCGPHRGGRRARRPPGRAGVHGAGPRSRRPRRPGGLGAAAAGARPAQLGTP